MKNNLKQLVLLLALLCVSSAYGQTSFDFFDNFGERWTEYQLRSANDLASLQRRHFKDSVSVEEMKEAFFKNKDRRFSKSPYEGFDSVVYIGNYGKSLMLVSPLKQHPQKKVRECRGVWSMFNKLIELRDMNGVPQPQLLDKLSSDKEQKWLDGEVIKLGEPRWYMGFIVSPCPYWDIYDEGKLVTKIGYSPYSYDGPDFFTFANVTKHVLDGKWHSRIDAGAGLLGAMHGIQSSAKLSKSERTFSVLLYEKPRPKAKSSKWSAYTLELLEPEHPDKETEVLFQNFKTFVEGIPSKAFKPYYTADFRIMTGRYYRVTVNKCGWLVEDYFSISNR